MRTENDEFLTWSHRMNLSIAFGKIQPQRATFNESSLPLPEEIHSTPNLLEVPHCHILSAFLSSTDSTKVSLPYCSALAFDLSLILTSSFPICSFLCD